MTSPTNKTKNVRRAKKASLGRQQKNKIRSKGTTPPLLKLIKPTN